MSYYYFVYRLNKSEKLKERGLGVACAPPHAIKQLKLWGSGRFYTFGFPFIFNSNINL